MMNGPAKTLLSEFFTNKSSEEIENVLEVARDWAQANGICMRLPDSGNSSDIVSHAPFTLCPTPFSRSHFNEVYEIHEAFNELYFHVANDLNFLKNSLADAAKVDEFTRRLLEIYEFVANEGISQKFSLNIQRADYMLHKTKEEEKNDFSKMEIKQVESNSIAASFCGLSTKIRELHEFLLKNFCQIPNENFSSCLPQKNEALETVVDGLLEAWHHYGNEAAAILFVVENVTRNIFDQRFIEFQIEKNSNFKAKVLRLTLTQIDAEVFFDDSNRKIFYHGSEISVVYFRAGYVPSHYPTESEWNGRLKLERSLAIKCPWIGFHLAGTKKVQQCLTDPEVLRRFLKSPAKCEKVLRTFIGMWGLENSANFDEILEMVKKSPENFVLKPQREGGGNNIYGKKILETFSTIEAADRAEFVLMERIRPPHLEAVLVRPTLDPNPNSNSDSNSELQKPVETVSELGIFGYAFGAIGAANLARNVTGGYLLRTKPIHLDEGGIMAGASVLDSPWLI